MYDTDTDFTNTDFTAPVKIQLTLPRYMRSALKAVAAADNGKSVRSLLLEMINDKIRTLWPDGWSPIAQEAFMKNAAEPTPASIEVDHLLAKGDVGPYQDPRDVLKDNHTPFKPGTPIVLTPEEEQAYEQAIVDHSRYLRGEIEESPLSGLLKQPAVSSRIRELNR